jgi:hypothetical protein
MYVLHARGILATAWNMNLVQRRPGVTHIQINGAKADGYNCRLEGLTSTFYRLKVRS